MAHSAESRGRGALGELDWGKCGGLQDKMVGRFGEIGIKLFKRLPQITGKHNFPVGIPAQ